MEKLSFFNNIKVFARHGVHRDASTLRNLGFAREHMRFDNIAEAVLQGLVKGVRWWLTGPNLRATVIGITWLNFATSTTTNLTFLTAIQKEIRWMRESTLRMPEKRGVTINQWTTGLSQKSCVCLEKSTFFGLRH